MAAMMEPMVTTMMHTKSLYENFSRPRPTMNTFRTTGWNALSICTNDTERCRYAVLPDASEMHSRMPTGSMPRVHCKNVMSPCFPSFKTPMCTSVNMRSHRANAASVTMKMGYSKLRMPSTYFCSRMSVGPDSMKSATCTMSSPKPCRLQSGRTSAMSSSSTVPLVFSGEGTRGSWSEDDMPPLRGGSVPPRQS